MLFPHTFKALASSGILLSALALPAHAAITTVTKNAATVGKYAKLELTVGLSDTYANPYDARQIDLSAEFTSPTKKTWKVDGFYDGTTWKVRFAANEIGNWSCTLTAKDAKGTAKSALQTFTCQDSKTHGWVTIAPNKRYLAYDDGTSFYGVGACHAWSVTTNTLDQMKALGFNTYVYWNGTYDMAGGNQLLESMASGLGRYDQRKCARLDTLMEWNEARDMAMIFVILPHDYASENIDGWPSKWNLNPYQTIITSSDYYDDQASWILQQNQYRYMIARWGYSRGLMSWQTVDEISGTNGWRDDQPGANFWAESIGKYFHDHDPYKHPTTASQGGFWDAGNRAHDLPNTEIYGNYETYNIVGTIQRLWNNYEKPCIMGETGAERDGPTSHRKIWAGLASGIAVTPLLWQFNQGWSPAISAQYPAFNKFIANIDFAHLKNLAQAKVMIPGTVLPAAPATARGGRGGRGGRGAVPGAPGAAAPLTPAIAPGAPGPASSPATATAPAIPIVGVYAITSDQLTFGWITGDFTGRKFQMTGLANGTYRLEWWNTTTGSTVSTKTLTITGGTLSADIPETMELDLAFKIIAPAK